MSAGPTLGTMERRVLGNSGIEVNRLGIGLWAIGGGLWGPADDKQSLDTISAALDHGVEFFDTADVYGDGHSEEVLARAMRGRRDKFVVGTKLGWRGYDGDAGRSAYDSPQKVVEGVEQNLRRLQTDYVDVIQLHIHFRDPTLESFLEGFERLRGDGKIRAYGVSSSDAPYIREFFERSKGSTLQVDYSILNRTTEAEVFPICREHGVGTIIRGALAMGILTGKLSAESSFAEDDFRRAWLEDPEQRATFLNDLEVVEKLRPLAQAEGRTLAQLALGFVLAHDDVSVIIPGARNVEQLKSNVETAELGPLSSETLAEIDRIVSPGGGRKIWPA